MRAKQCALAIWRYVNGLLRCKLLVVVRCTNAHSLYYAITILPADTIRHTTRRYVIQRSETLCNATQCHIMSRSAAALLARRDAAGGEVGGAVARVVVVVEKAAYCLRNF